MKEEMIRTFTYIFLMDSSFVVFNNSPPRMVVQELTFDLTCVESCFQANSANECFAHLVDQVEDENQDSKRLSLSESVERLCHKDLKQSDIIIFTRMSVLNLFTIVTALHCLVFHVQTSLTCLSPKTSPIRDALEHWKSAWDARINLEPPKSGRDESQVKDWQRIGFMRHAHEFRLLALLSLEKLGSSMRNKCERSLDEATSQGQHRALGRYDETSMKQVADLMLAFQSMSTT